MCSSDLATKGKELTLSVGKCQEKAGLLWESWEQAASPPRWSRPGWRGEQVDRSLASPPSQTLLSRATPVVTSRHFIPQLSEKEDGEDVSGDGGG